MISVLITGANGQLAKCIQDVVRKEHLNIEWVFKTSKELDITNQRNVQDLLKNNKFNYLVNCAAYTSVDKAESEKEKALLINARAVKYLAEYCKKNNIIFIHISTDFVFDGTKNDPYTEEDITNPINVYGLSKLKGEQYIQETLERFFIIRTSWVYSEYGHNFVKTMLGLAKERDQINVVNDQIGSPTYAKDLAKAIVEIISSNFDKYGIYNYSNEGAISWFDFSKKIFEFACENINVFPVTSDNYITPAKRPKNSVLDKNKMVEELKVSVPHWEESLKKMLQE